GLQPDPHALEFVFEGTPRDVVLGREVAEEGPPSDPRGRRDLVHRGRVEATRCEQGERRLLELRARGYPPAARVAGAADRRGCRHWYHRPRGDDSVYAC